MSKHKYSQKTLKALWARSGNKCAFPGCNQTLVHENAISKEVSILGEMAHIIASSKEGPRGTIVAPKHDDLFNLILLCPTHHTLVDKEPDYYTPDILSDFKLKHENYISNAIESNQNTICQNLKKILASEDRNFFSRNNYQTIVFHSFKLDKSWTYNIKNNVKIEQLAKSLAEQHFAPLHASFVWHLFDMSNKMLPKNLKIRNINFKHDNRIYLKMEYRMRPLDPGASFPMETYLDHEYSCTGDILTYIEKYEDYLLNNKWEPIMYNNIACMYLEANKNIERAQYLLSLLDIEKLDLVNYYLYLDTLGWLNYRKGDLNSAMNLVREALSEFKFKLLIQDATTDLNYYLLNYMIQEFKHLRFGFQYHLYFILTSLGDKKQADEIKKSIQSYIPNNGIHMLYYKRVLENNDSLLLPDNCHYYDEVWSNFFNLRVNKNYFVSASC